jgi:hypothetical protein
MKTKELNKKFKAGKKGWLKRNKVKIFLILFIYPNVVCFTPDSTGISNTFVDFMLGLGKYANVTYNCEGQVSSVTKYTYFDYGVELNHKMDIVNLGIRSGGLNINDAVSESTYNLYDPYDYEIQAYSTFYVNPFIGLNTKYFELNGGVLLLSNTPRYGSTLDDFLIIDESNLQITGDIRIGNQQAVHFTSQYLSGTPLLSESIYDMGLGFGSKESRNITWIGISAGPFQNAGLSLKQNIQITENLDLLLKGRIGQIESNLEGSISAGVRYNF